ncbi:hypothetical protein SAMN05892883_0128 [Jatrophihabitans sp. GAS493]|uniref:DUF5995 family protein n=1 Tax=Jatrophihabitans sp. GAS493 TaxID=1907575 RepID=UPI000BB89500|nr:DUF5995 family protein [Jatrophihabitans sp. GAS493]SOD70428.1 hypothetical protein SAMN05892883_0128 [Jatrophihabitans sp. GAS493]
MTSPAIAAVVARLQQRLDELPMDMQHRRPFLATYLRTTEAVGVAVAEGRFEDPDWVERWDIVFAELYLTAHDAYLAGDRANIPRPWRLAFDSDPQLPVLRHVLLGINAHVNYDLPQAMLAVIAPEDFAETQLIASRRRDHERIDEVLSARVRAEDAELAGSRRLIDRALAPLNRLGSKRFLREARQKVWLNVDSLQAARLLDEDAYRLRLGELEVLSAARIADLLAPGQVLLRLAVSGFGVVLPPP